MPTNLPQEYFEAERKFKEASTADDKIIALEELLGTIPKHKGTDKLRAEYRKKLSKFKSQAHQNKKTAKHESEYKIVKEGDARIIIAGMPNTGKSSLVSLLTNANPEISENPYSTWHPTPGMFVFENIHLQLIDTPPFNDEHMEPEFIELIKTADLILLMLDLQDFPIQQFDDSIKILAEHRIVPANNQQFNGEKVVRFPFLIAVNKDDEEGFDDDYEVLNELLRDEWKIIPVSVKSGRNINEMFNFIISELQLIRVYSKPPGHHTDYTKPFILKKGSDVEEFAGRVHKDFVENFKTARIWGKNVFEGQPVGKDHILFDGDIVELHL